MLTVFDTTANISFTHIAKSGQITPLDFFFFLASTYTHDL